MKRDPKRDLHLDFETYCDLDLKKVGIYRYVEHPSFRVLCVAWKIAGAQVKSAIVPHPHTSGTPVGRLPPDLVQLLKDPEVQGHAWNAAFEAAVLEACGVFAANPLSCTMQRALAYGLPGKLETACRALGLKVQKDMIGHKLMLQMTKPSTKTWVMTDYISLSAYCATDVEAEEGISDVIPPLQPEERDLSLLDSVMNRLGVHVDLLRVNELRVVARDAAAADDALCAGLTGGAVTSPGTQTVRLLAWLQGVGVAIPDVTRSTIEDALDRWASGSIPAEVLQIRLRAARGSTRKLERMVEMADLHGTLQGQFQFCGAGRTGRWSGRGVQVQNLPRVPKGFDPEAFGEMARASLAVMNVQGPAPGLDAVSPAPVLDCVAWSLRACFVPLPDHVLWSIDFSQIEARVLAWLAGQHDVLDVFRSGEDVYVWAAGQFGSTNRQLGKVLILALGFGMGAAKLQETARKSYGVTLTAAQAESFKSGWRGRNQRIVKFWYDMEDAAKAAILRRGQVVAVGGSGIAFQCTAKTLQMRLPSGRILYYHKPSIDHRSGQITYYGTELGGGWGLQTTYGGKLAENATQAVARDVMAEAMLRVLRRTGRVPRMTVHDELVYMFPMMDAVNKVHHMVEKIVMEPPPWSGGLPIGAESKVCWRYGIEV